MSLSYCGIEPRYDSAPSLLPPREKKDIYQNQTQQKLHMWLFPPSPMVLLEVLKGDKLKK